MVSRILRIAIATALDGQITYNGIAVPVYHKVPDGAKKPFIEIAGQSEATEQGNKDTKEYNGIVPIVVRTASLGGGGGDLQSDMITEQIEPLIDAIELTGYTIFSNSITGSNSDTREFGNEFQTNKITNFQFHIIKN